MQTGISTSRVFSSMLAVLFAVTASGIDPRNQQEFTPSVYPPAGFNGKHTENISLYPQAGKKTSLIGKDGKFTPLGQYYYDIGSDPKKFQAHWHNYFSDAKNWPLEKSPRISEPVAINQGHRVVAYLGSFHDMIQKDAKIDSAVKQALMNDAWKPAVEKTIGDTVNDNGLLEYAGHRSDMACVFHFLRTKFGTMKLRIPNIYTLPRAQALVVTILTEPWIINEQDRWIEADPAYLDSLRPAKGKGLDPRFDSVPQVKDGKILFRSGLFIGWKGARPSLHGSWDGLTILNTLFKYYPDPDPNSPKSIFFKWNQLPAAKKQIALKTLPLLRDRLWMDYKNKKGPSYCWIVAGKVSEDRALPSEVPQLLDDAGYDIRSMTGWAKQCWEEMFGDPDRNTNDGVQAMLAICEGKVLKDLKTPHGQQVPGVYQFGPDKNDPAEKDGGK